MKKLFNLTDIIIGIVVLSILALIVLLNISDFKKESLVKALMAEGRIMQGVSDNYKMDNFVYPTVKQPTKLLPQSIDFQLLYPDYVKKFPPKERKNKYWVDVNGKVWYCTIDSPIQPQIIEDSTTNQKILKWQPVEGAKGYVVYEITDEKGKNRKTIQELEPNQTSFVIPQNKDLNAYLVSAIDEYDLECPPVGEGYDGYVDTTPINMPPIAGITVIPETNITTNTNIIFDYQTLSRDPDGDKITAFEWEGSWDSSWKGEETKLPKGTHTVRLRVQDEHGLWSDWVEKQITVEEDTPPNNKPVAVIDYTPMSNIDTTTIISWRWDRSTDPDGDQIVETDVSGDFQDPYLVDYIKDSNDKVIGIQTKITTLGDYTFAFKVKDEHGLWSDTVFITFTVEQANQKPVAVIEWGPTSGIKTNTPVTFLWEKSYDPDGDQIVSVQFNGINSSWITAQASNGIQAVFPNEGEHTVSFRVQDARGLWSDWVSIQFNVTKVVTINMMVAGAHVYMMPSDGSAAYIAKANQNGSYAYFEIHYLKEYGVFVAVGDSGLYGSNDGQNWVQLRSGTNDNLTFAYNPNTPSFIVAGGYVGTGISAYISHSTNLTSWTQTHNSYRSPYVLNCGSCLGYISHSAYGNGVFVVAGEYFNHTRIGVSSTGTSWSVYTIDSATVYGLDFSGGKFFAVGLDSYGEAAVWTSTNGSSWSKSNIYGRWNLLPKSVAYGNGKYVLVGNEGFVATSTSGTGWTLQPIPSVFSNKNIEHITFDSKYNRFIAVAGGTVAYSTDGINWTRFSGSPSDSYLQHVVTW